MIVGGCARDFAGLCPAANNQKRHADAWRSTERQGPEGSTRRVCAALKRAYPEAACALLHHDPYQLLVATILSAQCTDVRVNMVTPELFRQFPDSASLAQADQGELETLIRSTGFFRAKSRSCWRWPGRWSRTTAERFPEIWMR